MTCSKGGNTKAYKYRLSVGQTFISLVVYLDHICIVGTEVSHRDLTIMRNRHDWSKHVQHRSHRYVYPTVGSLPITTSIIITVVQSGGIEQKKELDSNCFRVLRDYTGEHHVLILTVVTMS